MSTTDAAPNYSTTATTTFSTTVQQTWSHTSSTLQKISSVSTTYATSKAVPVYTDDSDHHKLTRTDADHNHPALLRTMVSPPLKRIVNIRLSLRLITNRGPSTILTRLTYRVHSSLVTIFRLSPRHHVKRRFLRSTKRFRRLFLNRNLS